MTTTIDGDSVISDPTSIDNTDSPYTTSDEDIIEVDVSSGAVTVTLASADAVAGNTLEIIDVSDNASTNNITVNTEGSETIDPGAASSKTISVDGANLELESDGSDWFAKNRNQDIETASIGDLDIGGSDFVANGEVLILANSRLVDNSTTSSDTFASLGNAGTRLYADLSNISSDVTVQARAVGRFTSNSDTDSATFRVNNSGEGGDTPSDSEFTVTDSGFVVTAGPAMTISERGQTELLISAKSASTNNAQAAPGAVQLEIQL